MEQQEPFLFPPPPSLPLVLHGDCLSHTWIIINYYKKVAAQQFTEKLNDPLIKK